MWVPFVPTGSAVSQIYGALPFKGGQANILFPLPSLLQAGSDAEFRIPAGGDKMEEEEAIGADGSSLGWEGGKVLSGLRARSGGQERDEDVR